MSETNADVVRQMFAAFADRNLDGMLALIADDVEFLPVTANLTTGGVPYRGHAGIAQYMDDVAQVWPTLRIEPHEYREHGDAVVVLGRVVARGGGMILDRPTSWLIKMRDGRIWWMRVYGTPDEAVEAAGR